VGDGGWGKVREMDRGERAKVKGQERGKKIEERGEEKSLPHLLALTTSTQSSSAFLVVAPSASRSVSRPLAQ